MQIRLMPLRFGLIAAVLMASSAAFGAEPLPRLVEQNGRHALLVDGEPFLILGGQCHNSSAWPATLPAVWREIDSIHANTLEAPVYWEQFESEPGKFDSSLVDQMIAGARARHVHLVLLWFGTWKNGSGHYWPLWMKAQPERFPRLIGRDGKRVDSPSPYSNDLLQADIHAFRALMRHLKEVDSARTVILVQVENEPGTWGSVRDYSPAAEKLFGGPVPAELCAKLGVAAGRTWPETFGANADIYFHAWSVARYVGQVAAAGKAEYPLPLYVNAALRDPLAPNAPGSYESGGATDNVIDIWKAAAPAVDLLAPDIYQPEPAKYLKVLELYSRPDNTLLVPETMGEALFCRHFFDALSQGAVGWSPFGIDHPAGGDEDRNDELARNFALAGPASRLLARLNFEGKLQGVAERPGQPQDAFGVQRWYAKISYGVPRFGFGHVPKGNAQPIGGVIVGELGPDEFLVGGFFCRLDFAPRGNAGAQRDFLRVEEVRVDGQTLQPVRIWNGDETDYGLNLAGTPTWLRVKLGTF
jgi:hypothetical protein